MAVLTRLSTNTHNTHTIHLRTLNPPLNLFFLGTGSFELRADGSIHEWTIENQSPAGSAKLNYAALDLAVFGVRVQIGTLSIAKLLRTHPPKRYPGR